MAVTYNAYDDFLELMGDNTIDMDGDTFKITLHNSYTFSVARINHVALLSWSHFSNAHNVTFIIRETLRSIPQEIFFEFGIIDELMYRFSYLECSFCFFDKNV